MSVPSLFSPPPAPAPPAAPAVAPQLPPCPPLPRGRPVTLCDGQVVDSCSEAWRMECFARHMLSLDAEVRNEWMMQLLGRHGEEGVAPLRAAIVALINARKGVPAPKPGPYTAPAA